MFVRTQHGPYEAIEIVTGNPFLHIHTQAPFRSQGDQAMLAAVTDVEADAGWSPTHDGERFSMLRGAEPELSVPAIQFTAEKGAESRAT